MMYRNQPAAAWFLKQANVMNVIPWPVDLNKNLILLYRLSGCQIREGVLKLLSSLKPSLRELDLQYNDLGNTMEKKVHLLKDKLPH